MMITAFDHSTTLYYTTAGEKFFRKNIKVITKKTLRIDLSRLKFISAGMVCGLPDLLNNKKLQKKQTKN